MNLGAFKKFLSLCGFPQQGNPGMLGGGGIGLKAPGIIGPNVTVGTVTGTTTSTLVATDTIPAGTFKVGAELTIRYWLQKTGTGTVQPNVILSDGTNSLSVSNWTSTVGAVLVQQRTGIALTAHAAQVTQKGGSDLTNGYAAYSSGILDETKAWTVSYYLAQSVSGDTSNLISRYYLVTNP